MVVYENNVSGVGFLHRDNRYSVALFCFFFEGLEGIVDHAASGSEANDSRNRYPLLLFLGRAAADAWAPEGGELDGDRLLFELTKPGFSPVNWVVER